MDDSKINAKAEIQENMDSPYQVRGKLNQARNEKPSNTYVAMNIKLNTGKNLELVFKLAFYAIPNIILIIDSVNYTKVVFLSNSGCFKWNSLNLNSNVIIPHLS